MRWPGHADTRVRNSLIYWAVVLLVGVLLMGRGYFAQRTIALYSGLVLIAAGVLNMLMLIVGQPEPAIRRSKRRGG